MAEETIAVIIGLGVFAAGFLPPGICPLAFYYRLTRCMTVTAAEEHSYRGRFFAR